MPLRRHKQVSLCIPNETCWRVYCTELATEEKTLFALLPTRRIVPTTITRITASITAYSAMSCPLSSLHKYRGRWNIRTPLQILILIWSTHQNGKKQNSLNEL